MLLRRTIAAPIFACALFVTGCSDNQATSRAHFQKAEALAKQGNYAEAILAYKNANKADKRFGEARFGLAEAYLHTKEAQLAAREFVRAADLLPNRVDVQVRAATVLIAARQFEAAGKYAENALKADPRSVDAQILKANAMAGLKDPSGAIRELEQAMQNAPGESRLYTSLGGLNASIGKREESEAAFKKATEIDPKSVNARLALAYFYWSTNRLPEAEAAMQEAVGLSQNDNLTNRMLAAFYITQTRFSDAETPLLRLVNQKDAHGTMTLGDIYARLGQPDKARVMFEKLLDDNATRSRALGRLATLDYDAKKTDVAHKTLDGALEKDPTGTDLLVLKSQFFLLERRYDEAAESAKKAVTSAPESPAAHYTMGLVHNARGNAEEAVQSFSEALRLNPKTPGASAQLARVFLGRGDGASALKHALAARELQPKNPGVRLEVAAALLATKDTSGAETELKALAAEHPNVAMIHTLYGQVMVAKGDADSAARAFDRALELSAANPEALAGRLIIDIKRADVAGGRARLDRAIKKNPANADLLLLAGKFEQSVGDDAAAEKYMRLTLEKDPARHEAYNTLGQLYMSQRRLDEARHEFEEVVKRQPNSIPARTMIGMILDFQKKDDESKKVYEAIVNGGARAPVAANNLAWIYASRGEQLDLALQLAQDAKQQMPDSPEINDTLGWVYYKKDMPQLAVKALESSVAKDPRNVMYRYHLGLAHAKNNDPARARLNLEEALRLQPNFDGADEARKTLAALKG